MIITSIYASLLAVLFFVLSARVILLRRVVGVGLNDGGNDHLRRLIRVHGNFAEYVPFILLLILFAETENRPPWMIHCLGILLVIGRIFHALGVGKMRVNGTRRSVKASVRLPTISSVITFLRRR